MEVAQRNCLPNGEGIHKRKAQSNDLSQNAAFGQRPFRFHDGKLGRKYVSVDAMAEAAE